MNFSFLISEPEDVYRANAKRYLTSHQLAEFRRCPLLYYYRREGLIQEKERPTPALLIGSALHALVLEGYDLYHQRYLSNQTKLTSSAQKLVEKMAESIRSHTLARSLLVDGQPEGVVRCEYLGVLCQGRIDWTAERHIVDLKTCTSLDGFESEAKKYEYFHQLAFYLALLYLTTKVERGAYIVACEKNPPFRCGVWKVDPFALSLARRENEDALRKLQECTLKNHWPTGYDNLRILDNF